MKGKFLEYSNEHISLVARVRYFPTSLVSTQFHVVFDDRLSMIYKGTTLEDTAVECIFNDVLESCRDHYGGETLALDGAIAESPVEDDPGDLPSELGGGL